MNSEPTPPKLSHSQLRALRADRRRLAAALHKYGPARLDMTALRARFAEVERRLAALPAPRRLSPAERAAVQSLVDDSGYTRAEARAWVLEMGCAS